MGNTIFDANIEDIEHVESENEMLKHFYIKATCEDLENRKLNNLVQKEISK